MVRNYLGIKPRAATATGTGRASEPTAEAVAEVAALMPERALDATQAATVAILKGRGWA